MQNFQWNFWSKVQTRSLCMLVHSFLQWKLKPLTSKPRTQRLSNIIFQKLLKCRLYGLQQWFMQEILDVKISILWNIFNCISALAYQTSTSLQWKSLKAIAQAGSFRRLFNCKYPAVIDVSATASKELTTSKQILQQKRTDSYCRIHSRHDKKSVF